MTNTDGGMRDLQYDIFISYSHVKDNGIASSLQTALQRIAKPWYKLRGMRVFRDETDLSFEPEGWKAIQSALKKSRYFLLLASEQAATSEWVAKEVEYWLENRSADTLLIALMSGDIVWDSTQGSFNHEKTLSLPPNLMGAYQSEPFWVDLRWASGSPTLNLRDPKYATAIAKLAAPVHDLDVAELVSEDYKQHRRTRRVAYSAATTLAVALVVAVWQYQSSRAAAARALDQSVLASVANAYQTMYINPLQAVDDAHQARSLISTPEGDAALCLALEVGMNRLKSRLIEREVLGSGVGYLMERWRQGAVYSRLRQDGRFALVATERGKDGPRPPGTVYLIGLDDMRTVELEAGRKANGRRLEYMGFSTSGEEIFVARQFYLDIYDLDGNRTKSVQLEYHAKPTHLIAGLFGTYVLVGDTLGHIMLADTESGERPQLDGSRTRRDAALFFEENSTGTRAIVVYESGHANLLGFKDPSEPSEHRLAEDGVTDAVFGTSNGNDAFLVGRATGSVDVWQIESGRPKRVGTFDHGEASIGLTAFSGDNNRAISLSEDGLFRIWTTKDQTPVASYKHDKEVAPCLSQASSQPLGERMKL